MSTSNSSIELPPPIFCEICKIDVLPKNYDTHINGKKHKIQEQRFGTKKNIEETGLYVRGNYMKTAFNYLVIRLHTDYCILL